MEVIAPRIVNFTMYTNILEFAIVLLSILLVGVLAWLITRVSTVESERAKKMAQERLTIAFVDAVAWAVKSLIMNWPKTNPLTVTAHPEIVSDAVQFLVTYYQPELTILGISKAHCTALVIARLPDVLLHTDLVKEKGEA
jgi:hypothetical protein